MKTRILDELEPSDEIEKSPAMQLVWLVWENSLVAVPHSWHVFNGALQDAMKLAIVAGIPFADSDIQKIWETMRGDYWFGKSNEHTYGEGFYGMACESGNSTAYKSFEAWYGRKPFILDGHRLFVRKRFCFRNEELTVTSFAKDQSYVVACSYHRVAIEKNGYIRYEEGGVKEVHKITHADIYAWNKERRDAAKQSTGETQ